MLIPLLLLSCVPIVFVVEFEKATMLAPKFVDVLVCFVLVAFGCVFVFEMLLDLLKTFIFPHTCVRGLSRGGCFNINVFMFLWEVIDLFLTINMMSAFIW